MREQLLHEPLRQRQSVKAYATAERDAVAGRRMRDRPYGKPAPVLMTQTERTAEEAFHTLWAVRHHDPE